MNRVPPVVATGASKPLEALVRTRERFVEQRFSTGFRPLRDPGWQATGGTGRHAYALVVAGGAMRPRSLSSDAGGVGLGRVSEEIGAVEIAAVEVSNRVAASRHPAPSL